MRSVPRSGPLQLAYYVCWWVVSIPHPTPGHRPTVAYLEIGKGVCHNLRRGADTPGAPVLMIAIRAACDTIHSRYT